MKTYDPIDEIINHPNTFKDENDEKQNEAYYAIVSCIQNDGTDYDSIVSSFDKEMVQYELNRAHTFCDEQAVAFLTECLKHYKE
jgi:hypothetical protein